MRQQLVQKLLQFVRLLDGQTELFQERLQVFLCRLLTMKAELIVDAFLTPR